MGVAEHLPPGGIQDKCAFRKEIQIIVKVGLCKSFIGATKHDCGDLIGSCDAKDLVPGTYANDSARATDYLDVVSSIGGIVHKCLCDLGIDLDGEMVQWSCQKPRLVNGGVECGGSKNVVVSRWKVAL